MPNDAKTKTLRLAAELLPLDAASAERVAASRADSPRRLKSLAIQLAGAQRTDKPVAREKGLILFAADTKESSAGSESVTGFLLGTSVLARYAQQQQVKLAVTDIGLNSSEAEALNDPRLFRQLQPLKATSPEERFWESVQAGVRMACLLRGKGTDVFGTGSLRYIHKPARGQAAVIQMEHWELAAMAGVILGAASVQTLTVISGECGQAALALAAEWSPVVRDYAVTATDADEFLGRTAESANSHTDLLGAVLLLGLFPLAVEGDVS